MESCEELSVGERAETFCRSYSRGLPTATGLRAEDLSVTREPATFSIPVFPSPVPSFFNSQKPSDSVQVPAFNSSGATSIFASPVFNIPPQEFTFGAAHNQPNPSDSYLRSNQNPNSGDIAMDGS